MDKSNLTHQSLTDNEMLSLLGISLWVFSSNCSFIIEMIDKEHHNNSEISWYDFLGLCAGDIKNPNKIEGLNLIRQILGNKVYRLFNSLRVRRNQIMHSFPTGEKPDGYYVSIYRKEADSQDVVINKEYLEKFIKDNDELSSLIYEKTK